MQAGILGQVLVDDGGQVLVVGQMLGKDHESHRHVSHSHGGDVGGVDLLHTLQGGQEGELGYGEQADILKDVEVDDRGNTGHGEDQGHHITGQNADDEGDQADHLLAVDGADHDHSQSDHGADERHPQVGSHDESTVAVLRTVGEHVVDGGAGQGHTDQSHGGADNHGGHQLVDPLNANQLDDDGDDHIHQTGQDSAQDDAGETGLGRDGAGEGGDHGADEGEGRTQEHRAVELGEQLVHEGADTGAEQSGGGGHAVAHDGGNGDGGGQNGQQLLDGEDQHLPELGFVFNAVDQIHWEKLLSFSPFPAPNAQKKGPFA